MELFLTSPVGTQGFTRFLPTGVTFDCLVGWAMDTVRTGHKAQGYYRAHSTCVGNNH